MAKKAVVKKARDPMPWVIEVAGYILKLRVKSDLNHPRLKYLYLEVESDDGAQIFSTELESRDALFLARSLLDAESYTQPTDF